MKTWSLSKRLVLLLGIAIVVVLGGAALLMDHLVDAEMERRFAASLLTQARTLAALAQVSRQGLDMDEISGSPSRLLRSENRVAYAMQCADGSKLHSDPRPAEYPPNWSGATNLEPEFADIDRNGVSLRAVWFRFSAQRAADANAQTRASAITATAAQDCRLLLIQPRTELDQILIATDGILLITPMLALLAVLVLSPALVRHGLKPLVALGENMRGIGPHAPGQRLPPAGDSIEMRWNADALIIANHGLDLGEDEVRRFGQRFWSKHHGVDGHAGLGLGLSLAGAAAMAMGFSLEFKLDAERRLRAILRWHAAASPM